MSIYHNTMTALEKSLTVGLIATDLQEGFGLYPETLPENELVTFGLENRFSCIPLFKPAQNMNPAYWITQIAVLDLANKNSIQKRKIRPDDLLSIETPILDSIKFLNERENSFFLVLEKNRITKILTISDLEKLPARVLISTLIAHLEGLLADIIVKESPDYKSWKLPDSQRNKILELFEKKKNDDVDTSMIHCTTLSQKFTIISKSDAILNVLNNGLSNNKFRELLAGINGLRNRIEHNLPPIITDLETLRDHAGHNNTIAHKLDWLAMVIRNIEGLIETLK